MKAIMESLPGGVEKPKIYMGLLVGTRGTNRSPRGTALNGSGPTEAAGHVCVSVWGHLRERSGSVLRGTT